MERLDFWTDKWAGGQIGFHEEDVNPTLAKHFSAFMGPGKHRVLLPLCGKTVDLLWLEQRRQHVVGVEFVEQAVRDFHLENGRTPDVSVEPPVTRWVSGRVHIMQADFFDVGRQHVGNCGRVWDRAAMVALPPEVRGKYVSHLRGLLVGGARVLLTTFHYPSGQKKGPPFSVSDDEVRTLYAGVTNLTLLEAEELPEQAAAWKLASLTQSTWLITI